MQKFFHEIANCPLFEGIAAAELPALLEQFRAETKTYPRGSFLLRAGERRNTLGIVLSGAVQVQQEDYSGNNTLLAQLLPGDLFGEAFVCAGVPFTVSASAPQGAAVLWLAYQSLLAMDRAATPAKTDVIGNLIRLLAGKNIFLTGRISHLSRRTLRDKVLSYLSEQSQRAGSRDFTIPMNRQALADFLAADRSALSAVLCRLRDEGILRFYKNRFTFL